jgi:hypothetical protein
VNCESFVIAEAVTIHCLTPPPLPGTMLELGGPLGRPLRTGGGGHQDGNHSDETEGGAEGEARHQEDSEGRSRRPLAAIERGTRNRARASASTARPAGVSS